MRKRIVLLAAAVALLCGFDYPKPVGYVNDFADVLPPDAESALDGELRAYAEKTLIEVAVVTVPSLEGETVEDYAIGLARSWGVGKKGKDNGVVLLFAPNEKKVRIETGYGVEPYLPDLKASRVIRETITPTWRSGKQADAVIGGARAVMAQLGDTPLAERTPPKPASGGMPLWLWIVIIAVVVIIILTVATGHGNIFLIIFSSSGSSSGGGSGGGDSGGSGFGGGDFGGGGSSGDL
jgi:uncharacterized protein